MFTEDSKVNFVICTYKCFIYKRQGCGGFSPAEQTRWLCLRPQALQRDGTAPDIHRQSGERPRNGQETPDLKGSGHRHLSLKSATAFSDQYKEGRDELDR